MLKKLLGLGIAATLLAYSGAAYAGSCDDGDGNPDPSLCGPGQTCDASLTCVDDGTGDECTVDGDCPGATEICDSGTCVDKGTSGECDVDGDCPGATEICDSGVCVDKGAGDECVDDIDCPGATEICDGGLCVDKGVGVECVDDIDCPGATEICDGGICVDKGGPIGECEIDADCLDDEICDADLICSPVVDTGSFVECLDDTDCGLDEACVDDGAGGTACALITLTDIECVTDDDCVLSQACVDDGAGGTVCADVGDFVVAAGCSVSNGGSSAGTSGLVGLALLGLLLTLRRRRR